jgi:MoaA/NifB/PqqE/SkfB family radical SAM enzyme
MLSLILRLPFYFLFRAAGVPRHLPLGYTFSVSYRCNSRCRTCNVYKKDSVELSLDEWKSVFDSLGRSVFWATISGGEPFFRKDLVKIVKALYDRCAPSVINIPTNGLLIHKISSAVEEIARYCRCSQIVINVSIDDIGDKHDAIRGIKGSYKRATETFRRIRSLGLPNVAVGIHTVISRFNVSRIPFIYDELQKLAPDSYITEIAEERVELDTIGSGITPSLDDYVTAVDYLSEKLKSSHKSGVGRITRAFRLEYYTLVKRILAEKRQIIPCYSGYVSAQISPDGNVWACCVKAEPIGNLRERKYDFRSVWRSEKAKRIRRSIKNGECFCPLANASYTNMLFHPKIIVRVIWNLVRLT